MEFLSLLVNYTLLINQSNKAKNKMATNLTIDTNLNIPRDSPSPHPPTPYPFQPQGARITVPLMLKSIGPKPDLITTLKLSNSWEKTTMISLCPQTTTYESFTKRLESLMIALGMPCDLEQMTERITAESKHGLLGKDVVDVNAEKWNGIMADAKVGKLKKFKVVCEVKDK